MGLPATLLEYGCYCHALICRVSNCCLSLHIAGGYDRVLENTIGVPEKSWNLFWGRQWEPWFYLQASVHLAGCQEGCLF